MRIDKGRARSPGAPGARNETERRAIRPYQWIAVLFALLVGSCAAPDTRHQIVISTRDQKLALLDRGNLMATYPVSTSKFGLGDWRGSRFTPLGKLQVAEKIGDNAPPGTVFKSRRRTGEVVLANSPGRDPRDTPPRPGIRDRSLRLVRPRHAQAAQFRGRPGKI